MSKNTMRSSKWSASRRSLAVMYLMLGIVLGIAGPAAGEQGTITDVAGPVEIGRGNPLTFAKAVLGDVVNAGDSVRTGKKGRVELRLMAGTVRLYENSLLRIPAVPDFAHVVELERGRSIFDIIKKSVRNRFEVRTPEVVVSVKGTRFEVDLVGELAKVAVFRGIVGVRAPDAARHLETLVREGFAAIGASDVPFDLDMTPRVDPWDSWAKVASTRDTAMNMRRSERSVRIREAAQSSAHRSSAEQLVGIATERNPKLARKIEDMRKERLAKARMENGASASDSETQDFPASLADSPRGMNSRDAAGQRPGTNFRGRNDGNRLSPHDVGISDIVERIRANHEIFRHNQSLNEDSSAADIVPTIEDPGGSLDSSSWDPTPDVSVLELASVLDTISYTELIEVWYKAVEDLQTSNPSIFTEPNPGAYEAALKDELRLAGFSSKDANLISKLIGSKIQD